MNSPKLDVTEINSTIEKLLIRIQERFPQSGLSKVCSDLMGIAKESNRTIEWISKPNYIMRVIIVAVIISLGVAGVYSMVHLDLQVDNLGIAEFVQMTEAALSEIVLIGAGIVFLVTFEVRRKRKRVITATNRLRCLAHIIDAQQLTKDPDRVSTACVTTQHSPKHTLNEFELGRYLDYCTEMLSLVGKIAFLYVQNFNDPIANEAVNDLENLTTGLSRKIWQKIMILRTGK